MERLDIGSRETLRDWSKQLKIDGGQSSQRGAGSGHALVPAVWQHATVRPEAAFGQIPVVS
ncbi:hypothetical protein [Streptomyces sp. SID5606]|uniref:hypothetical protein n=1 Tax=Streptomyces sp. SID5606 TaxID=2690305 RepID=UPI00136A95F8|nr:hypothetical protein [Streptomyces sp. SID5606]MZD56773.1 hypothetical protein [Streptomyces sp. SID5606]